jgi:hypothetical protein
MRLFSFISVVFLPLVLQDQFADVFILVWVELSQDLFVDIACGVTFHFLLLLVGGVFA